jgi:hypothetical protein
METRPQVGQVASWNDRMIQEAEKLRNQVKEMPAGIRREELAAKARQAETAAHIDEWLSSPGLQPPR